MIGRSHSPISSLDGQDQALKIPVGVATLVSDVPRGGGGKHCGLHPRRLRPLKYTVNLKLTRSKMAVHNTER